MAALSELSRPADSAHAATLQRLQIAEILVADRLRKVLPDRAETMAWSFREEEQLAPIEVVITAAGPRLIHGAVRIAAAQLNGWTEIDAIVHPLGAFGSDLDIRQREITETIVRFQLTALERAVYIAEWRAIHEQKFPPAKRGRKKAATGDDALEELSANFALNFTDTVQRALGLGRRAIFLDLKIATLPAAIRDRIAAHSMADNQAELLALVAQPEGMLSAIVQLILDGATSVADALATLQQLPLPSKLLPHEKLSEGFSRLKQEQQFAFFDLHADAIDLWRAQRVN